MRLLKEKEVTAAKLRAAAQLDRRKLAADHDLEVATNAVNAVKKMKEDPLPPPSSPKKKKKQRRDSSSEDTSPERKSSTRLRDQVADLALQLTKLRYKLKYQQQPVHPLAPTPPVTINTSQPHQPKSDLSQAASDALQKQLQYSVQSPFNNPRLF
jgi:hypothetical protein